MATRVDDAESFFRTQLGAGSRVLLINPPVEEQRYHWLRWNQPADLLRLSTWLRAQHPNIDVRLIDFMMPDETGAVPKHTLKEVCPGARSATLLWHFGMPFEEFEARASALFRTEAWVPDCIVITSLTSYWHVSVEKLLIKLCDRLGPRLRPRTKIVLYGNYPRIEPEHASSQRAADVALVAAVQTQGYVPDFGLYFRGEPRRLPNFFALDIEDPAIEDHLSACLALQAEEYKAKKYAKRPSITVAFFNEDVCGPGSQLASVVKFAEAHPKQFVVEGIVGIEPRSLSRTRLEELKVAGFRSLFVEHARTKGGGLDEAAYSPLREVLRDEEHAKRAGRSDSSWADPGNVVGFVNIGLPDDNMEALVGSTLQLNSYFRGIILKPFGYSPYPPSSDGMSLGERRSRWKRPRESSPQWYPYVGPDSSLVHEDYANLMRWQTLLNRRVRGTTFDFLDDGNVARIVRETVVSESWKPHAGAR